jgi:uncharacterized lipoprotein YddW (UPF0748 family)
MRRAFIVLQIFWITSLVFACRIEAQIPSYRALWVDAFHPGLGDAKEIKKLVNEARAAHFNTLFIQVRRRGEVFYNSLYDPKAPEIAPSFDPLAEVIRLAHDTSLGERLEVHAWMVAFPIWSDQRLPKSAQHFIRKHPVWVSKNDKGKDWDGESFNFDPANPNVQRYIFSLAMELTARYDIDGLSLDRIRYPGNEWGYTTTALARFGLTHPSKIRPLPTDPAWMGFRREQVTALVRKIYLSAIEQKPGLKISASTIMWAPSISALSEWSTSAPYEKVLQDWRAWMKEGILDLNVPMDYYRHPSAQKDFTKWAMFAADQSYGHQIIIGCGGYLNGYREGREQVRMVASAVTAHSSVKGFSLFSYASPASSPNASFAAFANGSEAGTVEPLFSTPAAIPSMPWKQMSWSGHLKGFVRTNKKLAPLDGARIMIKAEQTQNSATDATGFYGFANIEPGFYGIVASAPGYATMTNHVQVLKGKVSTIDFILNPAK